jgi:hypothetical protein
MVVSPLALTATCGSKASLGGGTRLQLAKLSTTVKASRLTCLILILRILLLTLHFLSGEVEAIAAHLACSWLIGNPEQARETLKHDVPLH